MHQPINVFNYNGEQSIYLLQIQKSLTLHFMNETWHRESREYSIVCHLKNDIELHVASKAIAQHMETGTRLTVRSKRKLFSIDEYFAIRHSMKFVKYFGFSVNFDSGIKNKKNSIWISAEKFQLRQQ